MFDFGAVFFMVSANADVPADSMSLRAEAPVDCISFRAEAPVDCRSLIADVPDDCNAAGPAAKEPSIAALGFANVLIPDFNALAFC